MTEIELLLIQAALIAAAAAGVSILLANWMYAPFFIPSKRMIRVTFVIVFLLEFVGGPKFFHAMQLIRYTS